jgi:diguanylate cyclase (GGDEF)-like protein
MRLAALLPRATFPSLRARLAAQYAGVFALTILCLAAALFLTTERIAGSAARQQLSSSSAVFDRLWAERAQQLQQAAGLLAKDFGFRAAVATGDRATAASALDNLKQRLGLRTAFILGTDGKVSAGSDLPTPAEAEQLWYAFDEGKLVGVAPIGGRRRQVVAAPVLAPQQVGWIVFAVDLDQQQMRSLEKLSPVPIVAGVLAKRDGGWHRVSGRFADLDAEDSASIAQGLAGGDSSELMLWRNSAFAVVRSLPSLDSHNPAALLLLYPHAAAMAAYRPIQWSILAFALLGLALVVLASWRTAARITQPLARLDEAAQRLAEGQRSQVRVEGTDELARLSERFNDMAGQIEERERRITQLAFHDVLTGLPNRVMFLEHAALLLARQHGAENTGGVPLVLMCLDLDNFKQVNDTLGHPAGDELLRTIADRLRAFSRDHFIARLGGDEFVVLANLPNGAAGAQAEASRLFDAIGTPLSIDGQEIVPGTSIGIAIGGQDGNDVDTLLRHADLALYRAKESGRGTYCFFEESLNERAQSRRKTEAYLRRAIERGEFELYFQPLFNLQENRICAFEALIRWNHPTRGRVSPAEFIPIAEETGLIIEIGAWAMRDACRVAVTWPDDIRVAVNVSTIQFHRPGLREVVLQALAASGLAPHRLEIEITESIFLDSSEGTMQALHGLKSLGVRIALDDFGTGYSSLSYLQSFPFDKIKIDRSFIQALANREGAAAVIKAITDLAAALGMETTGEGVEETEQLEQLKTQGCTSVQGFLFSQPVSADRIPQLFLDAAEVRKRA